MRNSGFIHFLLIFIVSAVVLIGGFFIFSNRNELKAPTEETTAISTIISNTPSTKGDWKTYINSKEGFSFEYPADWPNAVESIHTTQSGNSLSSVDFGNKLDVQISGYSTPINLEEIISIHKNISDLSTKNFKAFKFDINDKTNIVISRDLKSLRVITLEYDKIQEDAVYIQILSTFKFTRNNNQVTTGSCKSDTLGIEVKPDPNWSCEQTPDGYILSLKSSRLSVTISSLGRDTYCSLPSTDPTSPRYDPNFDPKSCEITAFFKNALVSTNLYTSFGVDKEIFGTITDGPSVSISLTDSSNKNFTETDKSAAKKLLESIIKI